MSIYEYDAEKHLRMEREAAREEGRIDLLTDLVTKKLSKGMSVHEIADLLEEDESTINLLIQNIQEQAKK